MGGPFRIRWVHWPLSGRGRAAGPRMQVDRPARISALIVVTTVLLMGTAGLWIGPLMNIIGSDPLTDVANETRRKLSSFERTRDGTDVREWLMRQDVGFFMVSWWEFVNWAETHQREFLILVRPMKTKEQNEFCD